MTTRSACGSQDSVIVPARNSSAIGRSSGSSSARPTGATAGITAVVLASAITSSSSSSTRSASAATCCFSSATLTTRAPSRAWRKKVRAPGSPTVPATKRSGGSNPWTIGGMDPSLRGALKSPR